MQRAGDEWSRGKSGTYPWQKREIAEEGEKRMKLGGGRKRGEETIKVASLYTFPTMVPVRGRYTLYWGFTSPGYCAGKAWGSDRQPKANRGAEYSTTSFTYKNAGRTG